MYATVNSSDYIQVSLSGAATLNVDYYCSFFDGATGGFSALAGTLLTPTTGFLVSAGSNPGQVQAISIYNVGPPASITVTVQYYDGVSNTMNLLDFSLPTGFTLTYTADGAGWQVYNTNGARL